MMQWRDDKGEALARIGPYTMHASKSLERDRAPGKEWDARIWRGGVTVAMDMEHPSVEIAKAKCIDLMRGVIKNELALMALVERELSR